MIEQQQGDQQDQSDADAPADQFFLDRQQWFDRGTLHFALHIRAATWHIPFDFSPTQLVSGGFTPAKNSQEITSPTQITKPKRLTR